MFKIKNMKREFNNLDRNELEVHIVGTSASGKSAIQLIIAEALRDKGFNIKINSIDHESEEEFFETYTKFRDLREDGVRELNDLITINEVQSVKRPIPYGKENV
jgi:ABC-type dipeptide/oligopeptide/nickel transport system ATPase component